MNATVLNAQSVDSQDLDEKQRWCLRRLLDGRPKALAVLPRQIPLDQVVAMGSEMGDLLVEFNAFGGVPAGSVRVRRGQEDMPTILKKRMTAQAIITDALSIGKGKGLGDFESDVLMLKNDGALHNDKFLGSKKDTLRAEILKGKPLEVPSLFMGYSPDELHIANWKAAAMSWARRRPEGDRASFKGNIDTAVELLFIEYRDEYRVEGRQEIASSLKNPKSAQLVESAKLLWGDEYAQWLETDPAARKPSRSARP